MTLIVYFFLLAQVVTGSVTAWPKLWLIVLLLASHKRCKRPTLFVLSVVVIMGVEIV